MPDEESFECEKCGRTFDSQRGLSIHQTQSHSEEEETDTTEEIQTDSGQSDRISVSVRQGLISVFVIGVLVGFTAGLMAPIDISNNTNTAQNNPLENTDQAESNHDTTPSLSKIDLEGQPSLGDENAPATMVIYEDFQCPYCKVFEQRSFGQIKNEFVDTGKLRVVWKDLPLEQLGHDWAKPAAETMECVYRQDNNAFWNVKNKVFNNQDSISTSNVQSKIIGWATEEGVSESAINSCLQDSSAMREVESDMQEARSFDTEYESQGRWVSFISGTPSFVIFGEGDEEGEQMVGAQPFSAFKNTINSQIEN